MENLPRYQGGVFLVGSGRPHRSDRGIVFSTDAYGPGDSPTVELELPSASQGTSDLSASTYDDATHRWEFGLAGAFGPKSKLTDITVRDYTGRWKKLGTYTSELNGLLYPTPKSMELTARITMDGKPISDIAISPFPLAQHFLLRALAWDVRGNKTVSVPLTPNHWHVLVTAPASKIAKIEIDECDATTLAFRNISLQPR